MASLIFADCARSHRHRCGRRRKPQSMSSCEKICRMCRSTTLTEAWRWILATIQDDAEIHLLPFMIGRAKYFVCGANFRTGALSHDSSSACVPSDTVGIFFATEGRRNAPQRLKLIWVSGMLPWALQLRRYSDRRMTLMVSICRCSCAVL